MDDELFETAYRIAHRLWPKREALVQYPGRLIVLLYFWSRHASSRARAYLHDGWIVKTGHLSCCCQR